MREERCETCRFVLHHKGFDTYHCKRHAPIAYAGSFGPDRFCDNKYWPNVKNDDWCGDWEPDRSSRETAN